MVWKAIALLAFVAYARAENLLLEPYNVEEEWDQWKVKLNKSYQSPEEEARRFEIFKDNAKQAAEHNKKYAAGEVSYAQGLNQFADLTHDEFRKGYLGGLRQPIRRGDSVKR